MLTPVQFVGELIERIKLSVTQHDIAQHSPICVRIGDFGPEMQIEYVKVQGGVDGPKIVLQVLAR